MAVALSIEDYEHLAALEDAWWGARAAEAEREGSFGPEDSERFLNSLLHAQD